MMRNVLRVCAFFCIIFLSFAFVPPRATKVLRSLARNAINSECICLIYYCPGGNTHENIVLGGGENRYRVLLRP